MRRELLGKFVKRMEPVKTSDFSNAQCQSTIPPKQEEGRTLLPEGCVNVPGPEGRRRNLMTDGREFDKDGAFSGQPVPAGVADAESMSVQDRNKALIGQYFERCWNQADFDFAETIMIPDYDLHFDEGPGGYAAWRAGMEWIRQAFPVIHFDLMAMVAEGDLVAVRSVWTATHSGEFMGIPPTGRTFVARNADFYRVRDGKMVAHWDVSDFLSILWQLGELPDDVAKLPPILLRREWPVDAAER
jgi:C-1 hydroxylase